MKDYQLKEPRIWEMIAEENHKQIGKWGIQDHPPFGWLAFALEELGELSEAISEFIYRNGSSENIVKEAIQTATLSMKIAEMFYKLGGKSDGKRAEQPERGAGISGEEDKAGSES